MKRKCEICGKTDDGVYNWFIYAPQAWKDGYRTCDPNGQNFDAHRHCAARVEEAAWEAYEKALTDMGVRLA
jgi:hypothetical protein